MPTYLVHFCGRLNGAIGKTCEYTSVIEAPSPEGARMKLYDRYEHIVWARVVERKEVGTPARLGGGGCYRCNGSGPCRDCG